ncbi:DUF2232 domain-containing protein [Paenibacillus sp. sgz500958]|uniref:DUF2232 domain-containing protein n=1 Tax=Paenibacillus sp. sgz500958 TaxID=3242475 RepID=UPI0036D21329
MKFRWTSVAWTIAYLLLLLSLSTPLLIITSLFMVIPAVVLFTTLNTRQFIIHILPVWLIVGLISPVYVLIAAYLILPALVMGRWYKKRASAKTTLLAGIITILGEFLLLLFLGKTLFQFDLYNYVNEVLKVTPMIGLNMGDLGLTSEEIDKISLMTVQVIPMTLIISSSMIAVITHSIVRPILNSMNYAVPKLRPMRDWRLPRSFILYYAVGFILLLLFSGPDTDNGFMIMISANLLPLLQLAFKLQAIGFLFFVAHEKKWSKVFPVLLAVPILFLPSLWIIGVVDLLFPLRERVAKSKR